MQTSHMENDRQGLLLMEHSKAHQEASYSIGSRSIDYICIYVFLNLAPMA